MRRLGETFLVMAAVLALTLTATAENSEQKWVMAYGMGLIEREGAEEFVSFVGDCKKLGYTHIFYDEVYNQTMRAMPPKYFEHVAMVKKAAEEAGIIIVPGVFNVGYSWRVLWYDSNLAAGLPVKDAPFVVKGHAASADPTAVPPLKNTGFEEYSDGAFPAWTAGEGAAESISADSGVFHSGSQSVKMTNFESLPQNERGRTEPATLTQTVAVEPFKYYRLTIWRKTEELDASGSSVGINATDGKRRLCYTNFEIDPVQDWEDFVTPTSDWKEFELTFNTLESTSIDISVGVFGAKSGTLWWDDLKLEPAGLANLLRSDTKPFVVKSADGSVTYEEGRDFIYVADPLMGKTPMPAWLSYLPPGGSFDIWHEGPKIRLTPESAIKDGDTILVSYFHPHIVYGHQVVNSLTDPKVFEIFDEQMRYAVEVWDSPVYFMGYDEIRTGGWEVQPGGTNLKAGALLAKHVARAVEIARKHAPDAELYIWSDMFDPNHNARKVDGHGYYLCNGDFQGAWEGLPSEVGIIYWARGSREALEFFADRGHKIIMSGQGARRVEGTPNDIPAVTGFMYTNWQSDFQGMEEYSNAIDAWRPDAE